MDGDSASKTKHLSCLVKGPGPKYGLPSLTGYIRHDPTRKVEPAFTIRNRHGHIHPSQVPGPDRYPLYNKTNRGIHQAPAYTLGTKEPDIIRYLGPSPADYNVQKVPPVNHQRNAPAYTMSLKRPIKHETLGAGPNVMLPTCIGSKIPDKKAQAAYSMAFSKPALKIDNIPGPAAYNKINIDAVKKSSPAYTMRFRRNDTQKYESIPGPQYDTRGYGKRAPTFAFGIKHSQCAVLAVTPDDEF